VRQPSPLYQRRRFPGELISHAVWLYDRFRLSYRDVEELLAERGIAVSYETVRRWCRRFGQAFAAGLRRRRPRPGDKWHADEVQLTIDGRRHCLWRAVDQDGLVLDILVQGRRNQDAAERFLRRVLEGEEQAPRVVVTDKLASYQPALKRVLPHTEHRRHKGLNNRAENSHRPVRKRERVLQRFKSPEHAQRFLEPFSALCNHFRPRRTSSPPSSTASSAPSASGSGGRRHGSGRWLEHGGVIAPRRHRMPALTRHPANLSIPTAGPTPPPARSMPCGGGWGALRGRLLRPDDRRVARDGRA
jgi:putative transposase